MTQRASSFKQLFWQQRAEMGEIITVGEQNPTFPQEGTPAWGCCWSPVKLEEPETTPGPQMLLREMYDSAGHGPLHAV